MWIQPCTKHSMNGDIPLYPMRNIFWVLSAVWLVQPDKMACATWYLHWLVLVTISIDYLLIWLPGLPAQIIITVRSRAKLYLFRITSVAFTISLRSKRIPKNAASSYCREYICAHGWHDWTNFPNRLLAIERKALSVLPFVWNAQLVKINVYNTLPTARRYKDCSERNESTITAKHSHENRI